MITNKETISRLKFIGKIEINDKIDLKNMSIAHDGLLTQITRTVFQDNRSKTLVFIQDTVSKAFEILRCYENSKKNHEKLMCVNVINDLKTSRAGLKNLKETYCNDIKFCCDIDVLLEMIDGKLSETDIEVFLALTQPNPEPLSPKDLEEDDKNVKSNLKSKKN
jgi:exonuclease I